MESNNDLRSFLNDRKNSNSRCMSEISAFTSSSQRRKSVQFDLETSAPVYRDPASSLNSHSNNKNPTKLSYPEPSYFRSNSSQVSSNSNYSHQSSSRKRLWSYQTGQNSRQNHNQSRPFNQRKISSDYETSKLYFHYIFCKEKFEQVKL